jgi:PAS domain S-box-containing protein
VASEQKQREEQRAAAHTPDKRRLLTSAAAGETYAHDSERDVALELRRQAALINLSFEPIFAWSEKDGIVEWNTGAEQLYGYMRAEALGRVSHELLRSVHPVPLSMILDTLARDGQWTGEVRHTTKDGRDVVVESRQQIIDLGGQPLVLETNRDVRERLQLEQVALYATQQANERADRLEAILSAIADALFVYDADGRIVEQNPAAVAMLAAFNPPGPSDETLRQRGQRIGGLRDSSGNPLPEQQWPQVRIARGEVLSGQSSVDIRVDNRDGREMYLSVSGAPLRDGEGAIIGSVCLYRDLTERWELQQTVDQRTHELEAANVRLRTLVEVLPVGVAIVDATGKPLMVNDAIREIWGQDLVMAESAAQYGKYRGWRAGTGEPLAADEWGLAQALATGTVSVGTEYDIETFDGRRKTILESSAPLRDEAGTITGAVSVIFDISERKREIDHMRAALEGFIAITQGLVEPPAKETDKPTDVDERERESELAEQRRLQGDSPLARRLAELTRGVLDCARVSISVIDGEPPVARPVMVIGLTPEEERKWWSEQKAPQPPGAGLLPEDRERLFAGHALTLDITQPPYQIPNDYGVTTILAAPMIAQGRLVGLLALDFQEPDNKTHLFTPEEVQIAEAVARLGAVVLEHDRLLNEREAARAQVLALAEANRRMDEFLSIAGHELRTPLTTVKANLQLAERRARNALQADAQRKPKLATGGSGSRSTRDPGEQLLHLLELATASVERQERMVQDLLDISRISSGRIEYRMEPHDLAALTRSAVEEIHLGEPGRRIELEAPGTPLLVIADADRIGQVFANYLTNALKYSPSEKPVVVTVRREDGSARVEVRDQGPGLSADQQRRLFERFYRAEGVEVVSGSGVGLGLGLFISKTIIEQHGGAVGVESVPGEGSLFWFSLPLAEVD